MFYGVAVFPSKEVQEFANHYRRRYDPHYDLLPPHLTVMEKSEWNDGQLQAALVHLEQSAAKIEPFDITFNRFSSFYPASHVVYMALADPEPMRHLQSRLCSGPLAEISRPYAYTPHLTIAQELGADEMHDILASLKNKQLQLTTGIDRFALLRQEQSGKWSTLREFKLGRQNAAASAPFAGQ
ncbi:2'-5' RNA ligase family protein [Paenibacillus sp. P25]|nr:2'-5' RNA ligase family protein [Paenibacillus sp. P25]